MNFVYLLIGLIVGGIGGYYIGKSNSKTSVVTESSFASDDAKKKAENFEKIEKYIAGKDKFTNDDLEKLLGVSDTTIGRYLDELEHVGKIKQVGKAGRFVYYKKA